jgi:hypothetical protein
MSSATDMAAYLKTMIARGAGPEGAHPRRLHRGGDDHPRLPLDIATFRRGLGGEAGAAPNAWMGTAANKGGDTVNFHTFLRWLPELRLGVFMSFNTSSPVELRLIGLRALGLMVTAKTGRRPPAPPRAADGAGIDADAVARGRTLRLRHRRRPRRAVRRRVAVDQRIAGPGAASFRMLTRANG